MPVGLLPLLSLALLLGLLAGCAAPSPAAPAESLATTAPSQLPATPTPSPLPPTETPAPSLTPASQPTPTPQPSPTLLACAETQGHIERTQFDTDLLPYPQEVRVYLPPCYDPQGRPYPVVYMIHGQTFNDDQWDRLGMDETADRLIAAGEVPPFLIVMPLEKHTERDPSESNFDEIVAKAIVPWVDQTYHTCTERACRAVGGLSRGATWAMHLGLTQPQMFGSIGAHSLTPFYGDVYRLPYWVRRTAVADLPRFYLDIGQDDIFVPYATEFMEAMQKLGIPLEWKVSPGRHEEVYWQAHVEEYIRWYAQAWPK